MPQSLSAIYIHIVFSTKDRHPFLADPELRAEAHRYIGGICKGLGCIPIQIGGVADHVHILTSLARTACPSELVRKIKVSSNSWIRSEGVPRFAWQSGYGAFSVSRELLSVVENYVRSQEEHHKAWTFQEEFLRLLREHDLTWDDRYVWD